MSGMLNTRTSTERHFSLDPWEELTGELIEIEDEDGELNVQLSSGALCVDGGTSIAEILRTELIGAEGDVVSILRVGSGEKPVLVNVKRRN